MSVNKTYRAIGWIVIYPVDSVSRLSKNAGQVYMITFCLGLKTNEHMDTCGVSKNLKRAL